MKKQNVTTGSINSAKGWVSQVTRYHHVFSLIVSGKRTNENTVLTNHKNNFYTGTSSRTLISSRTSFERQPEWRLPGYSLRTAGQDALTTKSTLARGRVRYVVIEKPLLEYQPSYYSFAMHRVSYNNAKTSDVDWQLPCWIFLSSTFHLVPRRHWIYRYHCHGCLGNLIQCTGWMRR